MTREQPGASRELAMGAMALGLALLPILHVLNGWAGSLPAVSVVLTLIRYALLGGIGLMLRSGGLRGAIVALAVIFLVLDILAVTGVFSIYDNPFRPEEDFIHFQF